MSIFGAWNIFIEKIFFIENVFLKNNAIESPGELDFLHQFNKAFDNGMIRLSHQRLSRGFLDQLR